MTSKLPIIRLCIIVGSQSGTAVHVAETINDRLVAIDRYSVRMIPEGDVPDVKFSDVDVLLPIVATHGDGELPDSFMEIYDELECQNPNLDHLRYGLIALGDRTYHQTFCGGGKTVDAILSKLGAKRIGERFEIDASSQPFPEEDATTWMEEWLELL